MNWFSTLFSAGDVATDITDKDNGLATQLGGWIGGMSFTEQEQAEHNAKIVTIGIERLKALAPFKVMQRIMVTIIMVEWAILFNACVISICLGADDTVKALMEFAKTEFAWLPVFAAITCYLLGGVIPSRGK